MLDNWFYLNKLWWGAENPGKKLQRQVYGTHKLKTLWLIKILENLAINCNETIIVFCVNTGTHAYVCACAYAFTLTKMWEKEMWGGKKKDRKLKWVRPKAIISLTHQLNYIQQLCRLMSNLIAAFDKEEL